MRTLHLVSHTHWDREWYLTFQQFRLKLVHLIDGLLDLLDADPDYKYFMLDGQTIVLDDYLFMRPERADVIRAHVRTGRLLIGPWPLPPGGVPGQPRGDDPQPAARRPHGAAVRPEDDGRLPPRPIRAHRADAADFARVRDGNGGLPARPRGGAVRGVVGSARRVARLRRVSARRLRQRRLAPDLQPGALCPRSSPPARLACPALRRPASPPHARHRPHGASARHQRGAGPRAWPFEWRHAQALDPACLYRRCSICNLQASLCNPHGRRGS